MQYKKFGNTIIARIDKGEEILEKIKEISLRENIKLANINALGATNDFTVGVFKVDEKKYYSNEFKGNFEIVSLTGTVSEKRCHLHISFAKEDLSVIGGHLVEGCVINTTCELVIGEMENYSYDMEFDDETGYEELVIKPLGWEG